jgi:hypothetical protein
MNKLLLITSSLIILTNIALSNPSYQWHTFYGSSYSGAAGTDRAYAVAYDANGNIYITGMSESNWTDASANPYPTSPLNAHPGTSSGSGSLFVLKLNNSGVYQWHTFYGPDADCYGFNITVDSNGDILVAGFSDATWNGPSAQAPINAYSGSSRDVVVLKLNSSGAYQWHTFLGSSSGSNECSGLISDGSNNVYISGFSEGDWGLSPINAYNSGRDIFAAKLDNSGNLQWHTFFGSSSNDESYSLDIDAANNIFVAGRSAASWDGAGSQSPLHTYNSGTDITIIKLNSNGVYQWHTFYGSSGSDEARGIDVDNTGNIYCSGNSSSTWQGDGTVNPLHAYSGSADFMILKLNNNGVYQWHTFYGTASGNDYANDLVNSSDNTLYIAGRSYGTWQGDGAVDPLHSYSGSSADICVLKLNTEGQYLWHTFYGGSGDDRGQDVQLTGSILYVVGRCSATWDGDTPSDTPLNPFSGGPGDAYAIKFIIDVTSDEFIPTLTEWAVIIFIGLLAGVGGWFVWRRA